VHQRRSDLGRYEITAPKSAPKTIATSFAANLLTRLVGFMPILFTFAAHVCLFFARISLLDTAIKLFVSFANSDILAF